MNKDILNLLKRVEILEKYITYDDAPRAKREIKNIKKLIRKELTRSQQK
jgi:hypothetical protein